jgi:hypothetical protein
MYFRIYYNMKAMLRDALLPILMLHNGNSIIVMKGERTWIVTMYTSNSGEGYWDSKSSVSLSTGEVRALMCTAENIKHRILY